MPSPSIYDHYRPVGDGCDVPDGVYRVVGTSDRAVTLLRVGTQSGRRVATGDLRRLSRDEFAGFEPAENPDVDDSSMASIGSIPGRVYWSIRAFLIQLSRRPLAAVIALSILGVGLLGETVLPLGEATASGLVLVGSLCLAGVGSGRL